MSDKDAKNQVTEQAPERVETTEEKQLDEATEEECKTCEGLASVEACNDFKDANICPVVVRVAEEQQTADADASSGSDLGETKLNDEPEPKKPTHKHPATVKVLYKPKDHDFPGMLAGKQVQPGESHEIPYGAYLEVKGKPGYKRVN